MPREFTIVSDRPVTAVECVRAAAAIDPELGVGRLWDGGGVQVADDRRLVLAVLRSTVLERPDRALRGLGVAVPADRPADAPPLWWTEAHGPFDHPETARLARRLAAEVSGTLASTGDPS